MPDVTNYNALLARRRSVWASEGLMDVAFAEGLGAAGATPCDGKAALFDAAHDSALARWGASLLCGECPIRSQCLQGAIKGQEMGVWGGMFSSGGFEWAVPRHLRRSDAVRSLLAAIGTLTGPDMVPAAEAVIPGLSDFFFNSGNEFGFPDGAQCIVRTTRQGLLPDGTVGSIRQYLLRQFLYVDTGEDGGSAHLDCDTVECVAPWHLNWLRGGSRTISKSIALALYATQMAGWNVNRASVITGIRNGDLKAIVQIAGDMAQLDRLPAPSLPKMRAAYSAVHGVEPGTSELNYLVRLCAAADELDCDTIRDLILLGAKEFEGEQVAA